MSYFSFYSSTHAAMHKNGNDTKDSNNHSFVGNWEQLTITDHGDTVIYHACFDVAHKIYVDTIKKNSLCSMIWKTHIIP